MATLIELLDVSKTYHEGSVDVQAVESVSLKVGGGEVLLLMGPSGSGKTTLLSIMGCILRPTAGEVIVDGRSAAGLTEEDLPELRSKYFGFVFQSFNLFPFLTARENIELVLRMKKSADFKGEALSLIERVGLSDRAGFYPRDLSGGQKQRVAFARALVGGPRVILADEPTANLDSKKGMEILELLRGHVLGTAKSDVIVSHDPKAEAVADRVIHMEDGRIRE